MGGQAGVRGFATLLGDLGPAGPSRSRVRDTGGQIAEITPSEQPSQSKAEKAQRQQQRNSSSNEAAAAAAAAAAVQQQLKSRALVQEQRSERQLRSRRAGPHATTARQRGRASARHVRCEPTSHASRGKRSNRGQIVVKQRSNLRAEAAERALEPPPVRDLARTRTQKPPRTPPPPTAHPSRLRPPARRTHPPLPPHTHPHTPLSSLPARTGPGRTPAVGQGADGGNGWNRCGRLETVAS